MKVILNCVNCLVNLQVKVEGCIERLFEIFLDAHGHDLTQKPELQRTLIVDYLSHGLSKLSQSYEVRSRRLV